MKHHILTILSLSLFSLSFFSCATVKQNQSTLCAIGLALCTSLNYICQNNDSTKLNPASEAYILNYLKATNDSLQKWYKLK